MVSFQTSRLAANGRVHRLGNCPQENDNFAVRNCLKRMILAVLGTRHDTLESVFSECAVPVQALPTPCAFGKGKELFT